MKYPLAILTVIVFHSALISCDGSRCGDGKVVDKVTNQPLDSVYCEAVTGLQTMYTDSTGKFKLCNKLGKCVPHCEDITVRFSKAGYKTILVNNPADATVYMER